MTLRNIRQVIVLIVIFSIITSVATAAAETKTRASVTVRTQNSYIYIASGGVVVICLFFVFGGGRYAKKKNTSQGIMHASLFNFDMKTNRYELDVPDLRFNDEKNVYMPIFSLKF